MSHKSDNDVEVCAMQLTESIDRLARTNKALCRSLQMKAKEPETGDDGDAVPAELLDRTKCTLLLSPPWTLRSNLLSFSADRFRKRVSLHPPTKRTDIYVTRTRNMKALYLRAQKLLFEEK